LIEDYAHPAYGVPSEETKAAIRLCARLEGMITDPVYEGKSMQGMIDLVKKGFFPAGSKVLYAHLGGAPAINGYSYIYRNGYFAAGAMEDFQTELYRCRFDGGFGRSALCLRHFGFSSKAEGPRRG